MPIHKRMPMMRCRHCDHAVPLFSDEAREKFVWFEDPTDEMYGGHFRCWGCLSQADRDEFGRLEQRLLATMRNSRRPSA